MNNGGELKTPKWVHVPDFMWQNCFNRKRHTYHMQICAFPVLKSQNSVFKKLNSILIWTISVFSRYFKSKSVFLPLIIHFSYLTWLDDWIRQEIVNIHYGQCINQIINEFSGPDMYYNNGLALAITWLFFTRFSRFSSLINFKDYGEGWFSGTFPRAVMPVLI